MGGGGCFYVRVCRGGRGGVDFWWGGGEELCVVVVVVLTGHIVSMRRMFMDNIVHLRSSC